jgi:hypothetical protein
MVSLQVPLQTTPLLVFSHVALETFDASAQLDGTDAGPLVGLDEVPQCARARAARRRWGDRARREPKDEASMAGP